MGSGDPLLLDALVKAGPRTLGEFAWSLIARKPRSLAADAARLVQKLNPPPLIEGPNRIPPREPFLLVANHYQAPGLWIGWAALAITAAIASAREPRVRETHWIITAEWGARKPTGQWASNPFTRLIFPRAAEVWKAVPLPANPADVAGRARALRLAIEYMGRRSKVVSIHGEPVAIFPEGTGSVELKEAVPGSGAFLHRVNSLGVPILPAGIHDKDGTLIIRFGEALNLGSPPTGETSLDTWARGRVMASIGRLLPEHLWGAYAEIIKDEAG